MKTPREILLARHRSAEAKLNAIRRQTVAAVTAQPPSRISVWRELFWPKTPAWAAVAAIWVVIFTFKLSTHDPSHLVAKKTTLPVEVIAQVKQQKLFFAELVGTTEWRIAEPPKTSSPRPHSDRRITILSA